ncbi:MAG: DMT family transporter [Sphaerochaetaceae bacterium]|jgi:transporter family-2 protein|nr:DMT family transporter [Sphaerochaetaceae bacterium]MDY0371641.1 DMT family transporter [Sphaerochaetaceae bacterium]
MHKAIDYFLACVIGIMVSFMVVFNTRLGEVSTIAVSFFFSHSIGVVAITLILIALRIQRGKPAQRQKAPWYFWFGGAFGFIILNASFITMTNIGASLAIATAVFGQALGSLFFDLTGFMGRKTYPISIRKAFTLALSFVGIIVMATQGGTFAIPYVILGMLTGIISMAQMVYNSRFADYKGVFYSARHNALSGFIIGAIIYGLTVAKPTILAFSQIREVPLFLILGGGLLAVLVISGTNYVIPKLPAIYSALILSTTQIITSIIIDYYLYEIFSSRLLWGALITLLGMAGNILVDWKEKNTVTAKSAS